MSVRFASTNHPGRRLGWRAAGRGLIAPVLARAANDNGAAINDASLPTGRFDPLLVDALRHFAVHGLASAKAACDEADDAGQRGDPDAKDHWLAITQMFDRRLAARLMREVVPA